jgi:hypothetical protein
MGLHLSTSLLQRTEMIYNRCIIGDDPPVTKALAKLDVSKLSTERLFLQYFEDAEWFRSTAEEADKRFIRVAAELHRIATERLWQHRRSARTRKPFGTLDQWIAEEGGMSRAKIYQLLRLAKCYAGIPYRKVLELRMSRANELARIAKCRGNGEGAKPPQVFLDAIEETIARKLPVKEVERMVANCLAGEHLDSAKYVVVELSVLAEDEETLRKAIAVAQARAPLPNPETAAADGTHVVEICREYLEDPASEKVLAQLEEAGAFRKAMTVQE